MAFKITISTGFFKNQILLSSQAQLNIPFFINEVKALPQKPGRRPTPPVAGQGVEALGSQAGL